MDIEPPTSDDTFWLDFWKRDGKTAPATDWFFGWDEAARDLLAPLLGPNKDADVLVVGCGNAPLAGDMSSAGYTRTVGMDVSASAIAQQRRLHPSMRFEVGDVRDLGPFFGADSFDVVVDKACADALLCYKDARAAVTRMLDEVARVTRPGGVFVVFSLVHRDRKGWGEGKGEPALLGELRRATDRWSEVTHRAVQDPRKGTGRGAWPVGERYFPEEVRFDEYAMIVARRRM